MSTHSALLVLVGRLAAGFGCAVGSAKRLSPLRLLARSISADTRWMQAGAVRLRVPASWGEVEPREGGGYVIHNRPRRHRIDGDAVWYGGAIELMIGPPNPPPLPALAPMHEHRRSISAAGETIVASLRIANGVTPDREHQALRALRSAHLRQL